MENFAKFTIEDILSACSNAKIYNSLKENWHSTGVSTDSRTIKENNIFIALKGEKFDGHDNIKEVISKNAAAAIVSQEWFENIKKSESDYISFDEFLFIIVPDTLKALGELAFFHRIRYNFPVIAIAGSNGKTTTKEITACILEQKFNNVLKTYKNFNNQIGVPMMIFQFSDTTDVAVIEIGTNSPGEIAILSDILKPDFGLITNIGKEHLEELIDLDNVEMEETFLFGKLNAYGGICLINSDDERLQKYTKVLNKYMTYGTNVDSNFVVDISMNDQLQPTISFTTNGEKVEASMNAIGIAAGMNATAAVAVGDILGLSANEIKIGLEKYRADETQNYARMSMQKIRNLVILNDCYNANPTSMEMSIKTLSIYNNKNIFQKIAILGDMFELGESSQQEHINILNYAYDLLDEVLVIGSNMEDAVQHIGNSKLKIFNDLKDIADYVNNISLQNESQDIAILLKGSRGMQMEQILNYF